jgi:hypothetical protein
LLQTVYNKIYLAEQRPFTANLELFTAFVGKVYTAHMWEVSIPIPLTPEVIEFADSNIVNLNFTSAAYDFESMAFSNPDGRYLTITSQEGEGWQWQHETLPIDPILQPDYTMEMNEAMYSEWVNNTCTGPMHKQYYHSGPMSYFAQDITL